MSILHSIKTVKYNESVVVVDDALLHKIQALLLKMMREIAAVCEEEGIKWCLSGGSIIGAVRHKGFIPWDDDIDIFMERDEFEKFKQIFKKRLSNKYELKLPGDKGYLLHYPQIQKKGTRIKHIQSVGDETEGIFIDIFIFENTYNNKFLRTIHGIECTVLMFIDSALRMDLCKSNIIKYSNNDEELMKKVQSRARFAKLFKFHTLEKWLSISDKKFSSIKKNTNFVVAPGGGHHYFGEVFLRDEVCNMIKTPFESEEWYIPKGYKYYLDIRYPSYMTIPKEEDRERHVYAELDLGE